VFNWLSHRELNANGDQAKVSCLCEYIQHTTWLWQFSYTVNVRKDRVNMGPPQSVIRACMLYEFKLGSNAAVAGRKICQAFGEGVVTTRTVQPWFTKTLSELNGPPLRSVMQRPILFR